MFPISDAHEFYFESDLYFHPKLEIQDTNKKFRIFNLVGEFLMPKHKIKRLRDQIRSEIDRSFQSDKPPDSGFPMVNTFVHRFPTGNESGEFLGVDIGGTNLRILSLRFNSDNSDVKTKIKINLENFHTPLECRLGESKKFFDYLAKCTKEFLEKYPIVGHSYPIPLGFTFSFGYDQLSINHGRCLQFGIQTNLPDALGKCPVELFQNSIDALELPVKIVILANDSTATLFYGKFLDSQIMASLILGSGTNVAYVEKIERDKRLKNPSEVFNCSPAPKEFIVNSEYGLYGDYHQIDFVKSRYDFELDAMSLIPNSYTFEKMLGSAFLGELFRLALVDLIRNNLLFQGKFTPSIMRPLSIQTADMSSIDFELVSSCWKSYQQIDSLLVNSLGYQPDDYDQDDCLIVAYVCQLITIRCAILCAIVLAAIADRVDQDVIKICCDGSLYEKHPKMDRLINSFLQELCPLKQTKAFLANNGSSIGSALLAACHFLNK